MLTRWWFVSQSERNQQVSLRKRVLAVFFVRLQSLFQWFFQKFRLDGLRLPSMAHAAWEVLEWWKWGWSNGWIYLKNYFLTRKYSKMYRRLALEQISILLISYFCFLWKENDICNFLIFYFFSFWPTELRILLSYTGSMLYNVYNI